MASDYFFGKAPYRLEFKIKKTTFHIGIYIPIPIFSSIYTKVENGNKHMMYPWEFDQHPIRKRLLVTVSGMLGLFITAIIVSIGNAYFTSDMIITKAEINRHGIYPAGWARELGFEPGDKIISINGKDFHDYRDLLNVDIIQAPQTTYTISRGGKEQDIVVKDMAQNINTSGLFLSLRAPFEVADVAPGSPADVAGIASGDRIVAVNNQPVIKFNEMVQALREDQDGHASLQIERKEGTIQKNIITEIIVSPSSEIGIRPQELIHFTEQRMTFVEALAQGLVRPFSTLYVNIKAFARFFTGRLSPRKSLSGPIGTLQPKSTGFWGIVLIYALVFFLWNIFPLPESALWEIIALAYEALTGKRYPYIAFIRSRQLGWIIMIMLMVFVLGGDIFRLMR